MGTIQVRQKSFEFCKMKDVGIVNQIVCTLVQLRKKKIDKLQFRTFKIAKHFCKRVLQIVEIVVTKMVNTWFICFFRTKNLILFFL